MKSKCCGNQRSYKLERIEHATETEIVVQSKRNQGNDKFTGRKQMFGRYSDGLGGYFLKRDDIVLIVSNNR